MATDAKQTIIRSDICCTDYSHATSSVIKWACFGESRYICAANVHMVMEAFDNTAFQAVVNNADLVTPDGMPLVWGLRLLGYKEASRVCGPFLTLHVCKAAACHGLPVALYGGTDESLTIFSDFLRERFPGIHITCAIAPPFRPLTVEEDEAVTRQLVESGARILFVGIGCPKQEYWMAAHKGKIPAVMLGVGAAFDFFSGQVKQAPVWMQQLGLEWLFRLCIDPRRLWKRYLKHNPRFVFYFMIQLVLINLMPSKKSRDNIPK